MDLHLAIKDTDKALACLSPKYAEAVRQLALSDCTDEEFNDGAWSLIREHMVDSEMQFATDKIREAIREEEG